MVKLLAAHGDGLLGRRGTPVALGETDQERDEMMPLYQLAERLQRSAQPVQPAPSFVRSLKRELVDQARRQVVATRRARRSLLIGAAALGSVLSVASVVGAIVFLVPRLRARSHGRVVPAPTS